MQKKILLIILCFLLVAGCESRNVTYEEQAKDFDPIVKVGLIVPVTGKVAVYGQSAEKGAKLALDQYNLAGGVLDRQVEMVVYDNKADPDKAVKVYKRMNEGDHVDVLVGGVISSTTLKVAPLAQEDRMPLITPTGTHVDITNFGDAIFRACYTDVDQGEVMSSFASEKLGAKTAVIFYNADDDYSSGLAKAFYDTFVDMGGNITLNYGYSTPDEVLPYMLGLYDEQPDVIFLPDYYNSVIEIAKMIDDYSVQSVLLGGDGWDAVSRVNPKDLEGGYFANHFSANDPSEEVKTFVKEYSDKYEGEIPNAYAAMGYEAMKIVLESIKSAGTTEKEKVISAMGQLEMDSITGHFTFDEQGNSKRSISIIKIENGEEILADKY